MCLTTVPTTIGLPDMQALLAGMAQGPCTNQWDIVCSYTLTQLNAMLTAAYGTTGSGIAREIKLSTQRKDPITRQKYTIGYDITLGAPSLQFIAGANGQCILTMLIEQGSYTVTPDKGSPGAPNPIPANKYSVQAQVPLFAMWGDQHEAGTGEIIAFTPGQTEQAHITLHFKTTQLTSWTITPMPNPDDQDVLVTYFLPVLMQYFQEHIQEIDYTLAALGNRKPIVPANETVIEPQSFVFATCGNGDNSILSLYIQTSNSGNPPGNLTPVFQPGDMETLPVPQGYHTSLFFSRSFLQKVYLLPQLTAANFINVTGLLAPVTNDDIGCSVRGAYNGTKTVGGINVDVGEPFYADSFTIDYKQFPYTFTFTTEMLEVKGALQASMPWETMTGHGKFWIKDESGTAEIQIMLNKPLLLSAIGKVTDQDISLSFTVSSSEYNVVTDPGTDSSWWNDNLGDKIKAAVLGSTGSIIPEINFNFRGIYFFKTTNLLFPGQKVITIDAIQGIHIPCDLILVGNFAT